MAPPPALMDDVVDEILLRLPPGDPAGLARASLVCKRWRRLLSAAPFRRRYRLFHGTPPLRGFIHVLKGSPPYASRFVSTSDLRPATRDLPGWLVLDCRHGHALFATASPNVGCRTTVDLLVWNPTTNEQRRLSLPPHLAVQHFNAAVLCAAAGEGCDHTDCHGGPFHVVLIFTSTTYSMQTVTSALVYSSESSTWGDLTSIHHPHRKAYVDVMPSVLVGDTLYFSCGSDYIFEYQLGVSRLSAIAAPAYFHGTLIVIIKGEKGVLEFTDIQLSGSSIRVWARELVNSSGAAAWIQCRSIKLKTLLPDGALPTNVESRFMARVSGFIEGTDIIFVGTSGNTYMVQLKSRRVTELALSSGRVVPYAGFYIPAMRAVSTGDTPREGASLFSNLKRRCFKCMPYSGWLSKVF